MPETVYRMMTLLCALVVTLPVGTNLGVLHLLWMLVSGRLLAARGAVSPGLSESGLADGAGRRAWAALGQGGWTRAGLLARGERLVADRRGCHPLPADHPRSRGGPPWLPLRSQYGCTHQGWMGDLSSFRNVRHDGVRFLHYD